MRASSFLFALQIFVENFVFESSFAVLWNLTSLNANTMTDMYSLDNNSTFKKLVALELRASGGVLFRIFNPSKMELFTLLQHLFSIDLIINQLSVYEIMLDF